MNINSGYTKKLIISLFMTGAFFLISLSTEAASQSDAIAVRVLPNTNHDSIETWYAKQGFKGSPQSLTVDGYEAIRDGRTVFVNAANIDLTSKKIYTNIYLISYNQESETKTLDILGQLVSHWKFNDNISATGNCSISTISCQADSNCPSNYICNNNNSVSKGKCVLKENRVCQIDNDCPVSLFCDSLKAKTIRDINRLGKLNKLSEAIGAFKASTGRYPVLDSGTYVLGSSMSVWPSWKETLWPQLALPPVTDPINSLGYCEGYEADTCWDSKNNKFINPDLSLPFGSYAFVYKSSNNGLNYLLCSTFETKSLGYDTAEGQIMSSSCYSSSAKNSAPVLVNSSTNGVSGKEFNGYLRARDAEGDSITWKLSPVSSFSTWSAVPVLVSTNNLENKNIYAAATGNIGSYEMNLTLTDSQGASSVTKIILKITVSGVVTIEAQDAVYSIDATNPTYSFYINGSSVAKDYKIEAIDSKYKNVFSNVLSETIYSADATGLRVTAPVVMPSSTLIGEMVTVPFKISLSNFGILVTKDIKITFKIEKPVLNFQCDIFARIGQPYQMSGTPCLLGTTKNGNYNLAYQLTSGLPGLSIKNQENNAYLTAESISVLAPTSSDVMIKLTNQYGLFAEKNFKLTVNSFCGDGMKQTPNSEGRGGKANDGKEECDGVDGVAKTVSNSPTEQYACLTGLNAKTPFPITGNNYCVFAGPTVGGGYCGDGYCQTGMENCSNCLKDCGKCAPVCGDGNLDPGEVCETKDKRDCTNVTEWITPPDYCTVDEGGIDLNPGGVQACLPDCSGWGKCISGSPDLVVDVITGCTDLNQTIYGYSCCELVNCTNDPCSCCGREKSQNNGWFDVSAKVKQAGFENIIKQVTPNDGTCTHIYNNKSGEAGVSVCECGESSLDPIYGYPFICEKNPSCKGGGDNPNNNSCVLAQDADILKSWAIYTNHTAAFYRCWR